LNAACREPFLVSKWDEEVAVWMSLCDFCDGGVGEVVVVVVTYDNGINDGYVFDLAGHFGVSFGPEPAEWGAAFLEDWIEEHPKARWKLDVIACMAEPGSSKLSAWVFSEWEEIRLLNRNSRRCGVWLVG
jgi:hypothetical protein